MYIHGFNTGHRQRQQFHTSFRLLSEHTPTWNTCNMQGYNCKTKSAIFFQKQLCKHGQQMVAYMVKSISIIHKFLNSELKLFTHTAI